jgi:Family of unknown function (DUF6491)
MRAVCALLPLLCIAAAGCAGTGSAARPAAEAASCFSAGQLGSWKAADARTIYLLVGADRYYRLGLQSSCPMLLAPGTHLVTKLRGSEQVCGPLDWDVAVSAGPQGGGTERCIVNSMAVLSPRQVAAIPKRFRP